MSKFKIYKSVDEMTDRLRNAYNVLPFVESRAMTAEQVAKRLGLKKAPVVPTMSELRGSGWARSKVAPQKDGRACSVFWAVEHRLLNPEGPRYTREAKRASGAAPTCHPEPNTAIREIVESMMSIAAEINIVLHKLEALEAEGNDIGGFRKAYLELGERLGLKPKE